MSPVALCHEWLILQDAYRVNPTYFANRWVAAEAALASLLLDTGPLRAYGYTFVLVGGCVRHAADAVVEAAAGARYATDLDGHATFTVCRPEAGAVAP